VRPEPSPSDTVDEENLLIEAISLLVQRQREMEAWLADQISQADDRTSTAEQRYTELESRLAGIEDRLERLVRDFEPSAIGPSEDRLARLREQVEGLKSETDGRTIRGQPPPRLASPEPPPPSPSPSPRGSTLSDVLGRTPADRFGSFLIAIGALAVVYAVLSQFALR
jgi:hypothetical protein